MCMGAHGFEARSQRAMRCRLGPAPRVCPTPRGPAARLEVSVSTRDHVNPQGPKTNHRLSTLKHIIGGAGMSMGTHGFEAESQHAMHDDSARPRSVAALPHSAAG